MHAKDNVRPLAWSENGLEILDQRKLPATRVYETYTSAAGVAEAIATMRVRGAPAIGIAAAYGAALAARDRYAQNPTGWKTLVAGDLEHLAAARPTAVNLAWALDTVRRTIATLAGDPAAPLLALARQIHEDDIAANRAMGEMGADLLDGATGLLTHCNTGSLATGGYGTALGVIRSACRRAPRQVFATETRPWSQGARLTAWELAQDRIPATLIADSAAAWLMKNGRVQWVIVGADRIAANGDTANKIGTYALAVLARQHGVRFMVAAPLSTVDRATATGATIEIEERAADELLPEAYRHEGSTLGAWNPVFDVTPAELIDALVTERGVVLRPAAATLERLWA